MNHLPQPEPCQLPREISIHPHSRTSFAPDYIVCHEVIVGEEHSVPGHAQEPGHHTCRGQARITGNCAAADRAGDLSLNLTVQCDTRCPVEVDQRNEKLSTMAHKWPLVVALFIVHPLRK
jgi:hypothetical protein